MKVFHRRFKDGSVSESWYIRYKDPNGKQLWRSFEKKKEAEDYLSRVRVAKHEKRYFDVFKVKKETQTTFNQLLDDYKEKMEGRKYFEGNIKYFLPVLETYFGRMLLSEINYKILEDFRDERKRTPTQHGGLRTERTVNLEMGILRHIFNRAFRWEMIETNPFDRGEDLFFKGANSKREKALTEDEIRRLVDASPAFLKPIILAAIYTGLRKGDLLGLRWEDIDFERRLIQLKEEKTGKTRNIVLNNDMLTLFKGLRVRGDYVFSKVNGKRYTDLKNSFQRAIEDAGIKQSTDPHQKIVWHTLRHTCISLLQEKGADRTQVRNYIGHRSEMMTEGYSHLSDEYRNKTASLLDGIYDIKNLCSKSVANDQKIVIQAIPYFPQVSEIADVKDFDK